MDKIMVLKRARCADQDFADVMWREKVLYKVIRQYIKRCLVRGAA